MHGFNQGCSTLDYLCSATEFNSDIVLTQESWLTPNNMCEIKSFSNRYTAFGVSAMENDIGRGVLRGRPRGGVCSLIKSVYAHAVTFTRCTERFVALVFDNFVIINVYLPSIQSDNDLCTVQSIFAELDDIISSFPQHNLVLGGDLNTNICLDLAKNEFSIVFL
jgi:exonuclease III